MDKEQKINLIKAALKNEVVGVIATVSVNDMHPHAALVGVTETDDLEIIFGTSNKTRKYKDLKDSKVVSFVIGTDYEKSISVQYEGMVRELEGDELSKYQDLHISKHPGSKEFVFSPDERMFLVSPSWIKYSDYKSNPKVIFELTDF